ncbi:uncharacterized protein LOC144728728 [Lampetra planeri]
MKRLPPGLARWVQPDAGARVPPGRVGAPLRRRSCSEGGRCPSCGQAHGDLCAGVTHGLSEPGLDGGQFLLLNAETIPLLLLLQQQEHKVNYRVQMLVKERSSIAAVLEWFTAEAFKKQDDMKDVFAQPTVLVLYQKLKLTRVRGAIRLAAEHPPAFCHGVVFGTLDLEGEPASGWADGRCEACSSCPGPPLDAGTAAAACLEHLPIGTPTHRPGPATPPQPSLPPHSQSQSPSSRGAKAQPPPPSSSSSAARATQSPAAVERKKGGSSSASVAGDGALTSPKMNGYAAHAYLQGASPTLEGCKPLSGGSSWEQQSLGHPPLERLASPTRSPQALPWPLSAPGGSPAHGSPQKTAHAAPGSCAANSNCNGNGNPNASFFTRRVLSRHCARSLVVSARLHMSTEGRT